MNAKYNVYKSIEEIYIVLRPPICMFTTWVGFGVGMIGELSASNSPLTSFVNITGCSFIGLASGLFWPISMPLLGFGAIYNRSGTNKKV